MKEYNKSNIPLAKELRKNLTPWERKLWYEYLRTYPVRFQRQKAIGNYIVDFYCAKARLVIELDGSGHYEPKQKQADDQRTEDLQSMNLKVIRFSNLDIDKNFRGVCEHIDAVVQSSLPQSASLTAPSSEGAIPCRRPSRKIYALGFFDGVHLGHQALLAECCRLAREGDAKPCAITFDRHPQAMFTDTPAKLINDLEGRVCLLRRYGMENVRVFPVTREVMSTPWGRFLDDLVASGAAGFVCGVDFRFGNRGEGTAEKLKDYCAARGLGCSIVGQQMLDGIRISSTHIRSLLEAGELEQASRFMGHPHMLAGTVVSGRKLGRTIGVPTANLHLPEDVVQLPHGVYACKATVDQKEYLAVTNIGSRPTVGGHRVTVEPWLLDFDADLYGKAITLCFYAFLRPERKFDSLEELKAEIQGNALQTRKFFEKI